MRRFSVVAVACIALGWSSSVWAAGANCPPGGGSSGASAGAARPQPSAGGMKAATGAKPADAHKPAAKSSKGNLKTDPNEIAITDGDKGKTVSATVGKVIMLRLSGNPSTGAWEITKQTGDSLKQDGKREYYPPQGETARTAGAYVFKFNAQKPGKTDLKLAYGKGDKSKPVNTFTVEVLVKKSA